MRTKVSVLSLVALLFLTAVSSSMAVERDRLERFKATGSNSSAAPVTADPKAIAKLIDEINAAIRTNKQRMLSILVINTDVAAATLQKEKAQTGLSFGEIYVAHSLALATNKKFSAIMALKKSGKSWAEIATAHKVVLKGSNELIKEMQRQ
jgi:PIN domain nuclease of toxin-antitoxin system